MCCRTPSLQLIRIVLVPLAVVVILVGMAPAQAPKSAPFEPADRTLDAAARAKVVEAVIQNMRDHYVFPEQADKVQQSLRQHVENKDYDAVTSAKEFAVVLTRHLQEVTKDKH